MGNLKEVNFFAHYYFDHLKGLHEFNTGLVLPDFIRNFVKGKRWKPIPVQQIEELEYYRKGALAHIGRDQKFHSSLFFKEAANEMRELINEIPENNKVNRVWFAAHLLSEMMLDRILIKEKRGWLDDFYQSLENSSRIGLEQFLIASGIEKSPEFINGLDRFTEAKYLYHYLDNEAMVYSLNRVYMAVGASGIWRYDQKKKMVELLDEAERRIFDQLPKLHAQMA